MKNRKNFYGLLILLALVAATVYYLLRNNELDDLLQIIAQADPLYLLAGLLLMLLFVSSEGWGLHGLLASLGYKLSAWKCLKYSFLGFYYCSITPSSSGGQPAQVYYMSKDGVSVGDSSLCIMTITVSYEAGMLLICLFMLFARYSFLMDNLGVVKYFSLFGAVINAVLLSVFVASAFHVRFMKKIVTAVLRLLSRVKLIKNLDRATDTVNTQLEKYGQGAALLVKKPAALLRTLALIMVQILSRLSVAAVVYLAFHLRGYGFLDILSLEAFLALGIECLPLPGSVGVAEAGFVEVNRKIFGSQNLLPAALLTRGISFYAFLLISGVVSILAHLSLAYRRPEAETVTVPPGSTRDGATQR